MKKIMLLGGSKQQIIAIKTAKLKGYYTILCDYLSDNPGKDYADKFYLISTTDKEAILNIAKKEKINGIVAYASDPAAPTAAYVSEILGLPTNPYKSVEILSYKNKFRTFLKENEFLTPKAESFQKIEDAIKRVDYFTFPIMVKPIDSCGSKGISKILDFKNFENACEIALEKSPQKCIIIEEFIEQDHEYMIGGDCFIIDGKVEFFGLLNCYRNLEKNKLIPIGKSFPIFQSQKRINIIKEEIQKIADKLNLKFGGFNLEIMFNKNNEMYIIEMGPRSGGNMIPDLLKIATGIDMIEATICLAMGEKILLKDINNSKKFLSTYVLNTDKNGKFLGINYENNIKKNILKEIVYKKIGDSIERFDGSNKAIGIIFLEFKTQSEQIEFMNNPEKWIKIIVEEVC